MPSRRDFLAGAAAGLALAAGGGRALAAGRRPNIVLILVDDLGWRDLGCYGNQFHDTPRIDALAAAGMRFTDCYAAPVCSPTRASILSGQSPARLGMTCHIPGHWRPFERLVEPPNALHLPLSTVTVAEALGAVGYRSGYFGKWHLGGAGHQPGDQGFEDWQVVQGHSVPGARRQPPADEPRRLAAYLADQATRYIAERRDEPFYLQVNHYAVHIPLDTTPELEAKYAARPRTPDASRLPAYGGLLEEVDTSTGRILDALEEHGLAHDTIVIFTSDNGGLEFEAGGWPGTVNAPLRDEKGSLYEGGVRVPLIVRWPGWVRPGSTNQALVSAEDFFPTCCAAAGRRLPVGQPCDGHDLLPTLTGGRRRGLTAPREAVYWHYPHYHHSRPAAAIRRDRWKLLEFYDTGAVELYNLAEDLGESRNLAAAEPDRTRRLLAELVAWRRQVGAQMPQLNPAYDPARAHEWWSRATLEPVRPPGYYPPAPRE